MALRVNSSSTSYSFPIKAAELPAISIGLSWALVGSVDELTHMLAIAKKEPKEPDTLIIYGNDLQIVEDPGILALNPMKLILVGAKIVHSTEASSLEQCMINNGWLANESGIVVFEYSSVDEAVKSPLTIINPNTTKPMVHYVKA